MAVSDQAAAAMADFRARLKAAGFTESAAGSMRGYGQVVKLAYSMGEVTLIARQGNDYSTNRIERVPHHDLGRLDLLAEAIAGSLPWPVWDA